MTQAIRNVSAIYPVLNMTCASCAATVEHTLCEQKGVVEAVVNLAAAQVHIVYDSYLTTPDVLAQAVKSAGFRMVVESDVKEDVVADYHREKAHRSYDEGSLIN